MRGLIFCKLKHTTGNNPLAGFIASSTMSMMLDESKTYTSKSINIILNGLNSATNNIQYLNFNSGFDRIYKGSSLKITIEFAEYFLRSVQIDSLIDAIYSHYDGGIENLLSITNQNDNINEL